MDTGWTSLASDSRDGSPSSTPKLAIIDPNTGGKGVKGAFQKGGK